MHWKKRNALSVVVSSMSGLETEWKWQWWPFGSHTVRGQESEEQGLAPPKKSSNVLGPSLPEPKGAYCEL